MQRDDRVYLVDMLDAARETYGYVQGKTRADYDAEPGLRRTLERMIQIIGEAARLVPQELRDTNPRIPWGKIVGMRNRIVHNYQDVDNDIVWNTAKREIPQMIAELETMLPPALRAAPDTPPEPPRG